MDSKTQLGASPLPVYSREVRLLELQLAPPSPPSIRLIPRSPAAAPAAGGRGIDGSVHSSVGVCWVSAELAMAEEVCSVLVLQVAVLPLDGGAPWSSGVDLPPTARPRLCGAVRLVSPLAGVRGTADPAQEPSMDAGVQRRDDDGGFWRSSFGIDARRLPAGLGMLLFQDRKSVV